MALMNPILRDFWNTKSRYKVLTGGRGSSKSHDACGRLTYLTKNYRLKVLAVRQFQNKIEDSVYTLIKDKIEAFGYTQDFRILNNKIHSKTTESEFLFYGINRNITEIKSTENVDILYIEEAHALTKTQWDILKPTIRKNNSEIWIVFNPNLITDFAYQRFVVNTPKDCIVRHINYNENPFASETFLKEVEEAKEEDFEEYRHVYLGEVKQDDDDSVIKRKWLYSCVDAHKKLNIEVVGQSSIGYDVADSGSDSNCYVLRKGILTTDLKEWKGKEDELRLSSKKVWDVAREEKALVNYDCIGVGAGVGSNFLDFNEKDSEHIKYSKFNAGASVDKPKQNYKRDIKNKDMFANLKAQAWWNISDRIKMTHNAIENGGEYKEDDIISIDSDLNGLNELITELSTPRKDFDNTNRVKVESKKDLAKRGIPSPNKADAFIMAYYIKKSNSFF